MLDIRFVREHTEAVKEDLLKRRDNEKITLLDELLGKDELWRTLKGQTDELRAQRNKLSQEINATKKAGNDATSLLDLAKKIPERIAENEKRMQDLEQAIKGILMRLPNIMHQSVPYGKDDTENEIVQTFGKKPTFTFTPKNHTEIIESLNLVDLERAAKTSGSRFYFLKGDLAMLEFALQLYAIQFMTAKGFELVTPPHMLRRSAYEGVTSLSDFEDTIYKIQDEDLYMIATSEHPLTAMFQDEVIESQSLPIKMIGISPCYRKEVGSHGKDEKGIWRVHQFNKIEQIIICKPEESWDWHEQLVTNAVQFFESLGLHFHQVNICTGDLGIVAAKKYDLEAWIPSVSAYKEVVSCSNCTTYQAVRLNMKYRDGNENKWVHTLNSTCVATTRALVAILEQCQQPDGTIKIPEPLRQFMNGREKIVAQRSISTC